MHEGDDSSYAYKEPEHADEVKQQEAKERSTGRGEEVEGEGRADEEHGDDGINVAEEKDEAAPPPLVVIESDKGKLGGAGAQEKKKGGGARKGWGKCMSQ